LRARANWLDICDAAGPDGHAVVGDAQGLEKVEKGVCWEMGGGLTVVVAGWCGWRLVAAAFGAARDFTGAE
jgi:hypothetical protein